MKMTDTRLWVSREVLVTGINSTTASRIAQRFLDTEIEQLDAKVATVRPGPNTYIIAFSAGVTEPRWHEAFLTACIAGALGRYDINSNQATWGKCVSERLEHDD